MLCTTDRPYKIHRAAIHHFIQRGAVEWWWPNKCHWLHSLHSAAREPRHQFNQENGGRKGGKDAGNKDVPETDMESKECGGRTVEKGGGERLIEGAGKCRTLEKLKHSRGASSHQLKGCDPRSPGNSCCCGIPPDLWGHLQMATLRPLFCSSCACICFFVIDWYLPYVDIWLCVCFCSSGTEAMNVYDSSPWHSCARGGYFRLRGVKWYKW